MLKKPEPLREHYHLRLLLPSKTTNLPILQVHLSTSRTLHFTTSVLFYNVELGPSQNYAFSELVRVTL